jgi:hypothetical protein
MNDLQTLADEILANLDDDAALTIFADRLDAAGHKDHGDAVRNHLRDAAERRDRCAHFTTDHGIGTRVRLENHTRDQRRSLVKGVVRMIRTTALLRKSGSSSLPRTRPTEPSAG